MDLEIEGRHALLFDDDANAAFVNSRAALVPWTGDESVLIDRYDVRHLLDRIPPRPKKQRFVEETGGVSQTELDRERFLDLPLNDDDEGGDERGRMLCILDEHLSQCQKQLKDQKQQVLIKPFPFLMSTMMVPLIQAVLG